VGVFRQPTSGKEGDNFISNNEPRGDVLEKQHAEDLGVSRNVLVKLRAQHLIEGEHYKKEGRGIVLTSAGIVELSRHLSVQPSEKKERTPVDLTVCRLVRNHRVVIATDGGDDVTVRVRNSANLRRGMILKGCTPVHGQSGLFEFSGRLPRTSGRW
jgi:hypothetical protein